MMTLGLSLFFSVVGADLQCDEAFNDYNEFGGE